MKKFFTGIIAIFAVLIIVTACGTSSAATTSEVTATSPAAVAVNDLDTVIEDAALQMEDSITEGTTIALVSIASSSAQLSNYMLGRLEAAIVSGKRLFVVDRANLDRVREEQGFQYSGEVDDESAKEIGMLLGAGAIVTGSFTDLGDVFSLSLKAINMDTAMIAVSLMEDVARSSRIETLLASGGGAGGGAEGSAAAASGNNNQSQTSAQTAPASAASSYKIGDVGPAGGFIFYDKGNSMGGWRYLEAAPADLETTFSWATENINIGEARVREVGKGKSNTEIIMKVASERGGGFGWAAQACDVYSLNGFDDWFLPSRDELNYMHGNLNMQGLGNFKDAWYWSSTENDMGNAWSQNFGNGNQSDRGYKLNNPRLVRPVRQF